MGMSRSEAGKLGALKTKPIQEAQYKKRVEKYKLTPTVCLYCGTPFSYEKRKNKFCNHSCAASLNNIGKVHNGKRRPTSIRLCKFCQTILNDVKGANVFCNKECSSNYRTKIHYEELLSGNLVNFDDRTIRLLLIKYEGNECSICHIMDWNDQPMNMQLDHIDGNSSNNIYENVRLICPNCDAQSDTYKGKNKGNGRAYRRQRYADGKSY